MKKVVLIGLFLLICTTLVFSQNSFDKGCIFISGNAGFASAGGDLNKDTNRDGVAEGDNITTISLEPHFNYFVAKNIFIGVGLKFDRTSQGDWYKTGFGIGPNLGVGLLSPGSKAWPFLMAAISFNSGKEKAEIEQKMTGSDIILGGGVIFSVRPHLGIVMDISYNLQKVKPEGADKSISGNILKVGIGLAGLIF